MKKQLIFGSFIALSYVSYSQASWNSTTEEYEIVTTKPEKGLRITQNATSNPKGAAALHLKNNTPITTGGHLWSLFSLGEGNTTWGAGNFVIGGSGDNGVNYNSIFSIQKNTGNVGIGTTSPAVRLDVTGSLRATTNIEVGPGPFNSAVPLSINQTLGQNAGDKKTCFQIANGLGMNIEYLKIFDKRNTAGNNWYNNELRIQKTVDATDMHYISFKGSATNPSLNFGYGNSDLMSILDNGQVYIGATKAQSPHADYKLSVAGKIVAQSLYITASGLPNWADYVFAPEYKLQNLYDVEKYYKANKHLPEIPSAKEVEEKGIDVGAMNTLLLKKIEELTIHMVEQQKQIDKQEHEINLLKTK
ncbi:MAG: hypothetical protein H0W73_10525 [Bacteroidetes bacterium]|nr:hypothetical protein [Bacteroidota bacterium]